MADKTVVVPVVHPSGEVHEIEIDPSTPIADFHDALGDAYHHNGPTAEGALENSPAFRKAASNAIAASRNFQAPMEAGFQLDARGTAGPIQTSEGQSGDTAHHLKMNAARDSMGSFHTHNAKTGSDGPSPDDISNARSLHKTVYVASRTGLHAIDPSGNISTVFSRGDWASKK